MMEKDKSKQYIYIVQASLEPSKCKIGKTNNLERRLNEYNNMTGKSRENIYRYLFTCEVKNMTEVENDIKEKYSALREEKSKEIYFYNSVLFDDYVNFIKSHELFVEEIFIKTVDKKETVKIVKKTTPSLEERGISRKEILQKAQKINNDEFYTRYEDVEKELSMYNKNIWKDTTVFCNCDDAIDNDDDRKNSAFALYFRTHFKELGLKKLICTHYAGKVDLFNQGSKAYVAYISCTTDGEKIYKDYPKGYDGSFDHPLSLRILHEEADIVCTNPPFSRMQEYWKIVVESGKKFLIISNVTNVKNQPYILYIRNSRVWSGYNEVYWYLNPKRELTRAAGYWFTNFPVKDRPKYKNLKIVLLKDIPEKYKKYDDAKTLIVDEGYIPCNYKKPFAVSVNPILNGLLERGYKLIEDREYVPYINGKRCFGRILVQKI